MSAMHTRRSRSQRWGAQRLSFGLYPVAGLSVAILGCYAVLTHYVET
jgi:hypothetical protein